MVYYGILVWYTSLWYKYGTMVYYGISIVYYGILCYTTSMVDQH